MTVKKKAAEDKQEAGTKSLHDWLRDNKRSPADNVTFADLISVTGVGGEGPTRDAEAEDKEARRAELQRQIDELNA